MFQTLVDDNSSCVSDHSRLNNVFTYFNDGGTSSIWIDHVLCSQVLGNLVEALIIGGDPGGITILRGSADRPLFRVGVTNRILTPTFN
jgi:hypothetical protein